MKFSLRLLFASLVLAPAALFAASFEGKISFKISEGRSKPQEMHYIMKGDKLRMEMGTGKEAGAMIMDLKKKEMLMLMDSEKMYMVMPIPESAAETVAKKGEEVKLEKTNETEKILGYTATKYIATTDKTKSELWLAEGLGSFMAMNREGPMGGGKRGGAAGKDWERALAGKDLFPLRVVGLNKAGKEDSRMEVTAISKEKQPDSLFNPPAGYQKFDMGGMMKGMIPGLGR